AVLLCAADLLFIWAVHTRTGKLTIDGRGITLARWGTARLTWAEVRAGEIRRERGSFWGALKVFGPEIETVWMTKCKKVIVRKLMGTGWPLDDIEEAVKTWKEYARSARESMGESAGTEEANLSPSDQALLDRFVKYCHRVGGACILPGVLGTTASLAMWGTLRRPTTEDYQLMAVFTAMSVGFLVAGCGLFSRRLWAIWIVVVLMSIATPIGAIAGLPEIFLVGILDLLASIYALILGLRVRAAGIPLQAGAVTVRRRDES
ncbi:MAG: hypothetical protein HY720_12725, partial [Planctomycetes bacterium]|nr:hypothetical protein [Planctomycetota bacterium]